MRQIDQHTIREQNIRKILMLLSERGAATRQELAEFAGLSLMTVSNLIDQLKEQGVLQLSMREREGDARRCSGRKAETIRLNGEGHAWLVLNISSRYFHFTLLGFDLSILLEQRWHSMAKQSYAENLESFLRDVRGKLQSALAGRKLLGTAVVTPGPYDIGRDQVRNQRLPGLNGVKLKAMLARCLGPQEYYVDEDVKFAVRAYGQMAERSECEILYYLYIGEGVGGAALHHGNMLRGLNAVAGDAGQLWDDRGMPYENALSLYAFARALALEDAEAQGPEALFARLAALAADQPEVYRQAVKSAADTAAALLHSVVWMLDPGLIVVDCCYAAPFEADFSAEIERRLRAFWGANHLLPRLFVAPRDKNSVLQGAILVLQREWVERILA